MFNYFTRSVGCGAAPSAQYANVTSEVKDYYIDGDVVTYQCNTGFGTHKRICLSDGSWSEDSKLCGGKLSAIGVCIVCH